MYNYFKDTNLIEVYEYLLKNNMLDSFNKTIVLENEDYKNYKEIMSKIKKDNKNN